MQPSRTSKRLLNELKELQKTIDNGITIKLENEEDLLNWIAIIQGPDETPYYGGKFELKIKFPENYPFKAPEIKFLTKIYHPNIKTDSGEICQDIYASTWAPTQKVKDIFEKLISMMREPQTQTPLEADICDEFVKNYSKFVEKAKAWTVQYAS